MIKRRKLWENKNIFKFIKECFYLLYGISIEGKKTKTNDV